jgi:hypothetical protein
MRAISDQYGPSDKKGEFNPLFLSFLDEAGNIGAAS